MAWLPLPNLAKRTKEIGPVVKEAFLFLFIFGAIAFHIWKCSAFHEGCEVEAEVLVGLT